MLIKAIPIKNTISERILSVEILAILKSKQPITKLNNAHTTFNAGDESPLPGGFEKGVGNLFPEIPFTKCGTELARNIPAPNPLK
jgi:hypothetical protein